MAVNTEGRRSAAPPGDTRKLTRNVEDFEEKYDAQFKVVFDAIRALMAPPENARRSIGFKVEEARPVYGTHRPVPIKRVRRVAGGYQR